MSAPSTDNPEDEWDGGLLTTFVFCFAIFAIVMPIWLFWRRKFPRVYYPRKLDDPLQDTLVKWIPPTVLLRGTALLKHTGLLGAILLEWKQLALLFLLIICGIGLLIIMPVYLSQAPSELTFFDSLTAEAIPPGSPLTWITFIYAFIIALGFLGLIFFHRRGYARARSLHNSLGGGYLLVAELSHIPKSVKSEKDIAEIIENKSNRKVKKLSIVWKGKDTEKNQSKRLKYQRKVKGYRKIMEETGERPLFRPSPIKEVPGIFFCNCHKIDALEYYEKKENKVERKLTTAREAALESREHSGYAFVVFESIEDRKAVTDSWKDMIKGDTTLGANHWKLEPAKPVEELYWKNYNIPTPRRRLIQLAGTIFILVLAMFWSIPIALLSNLENVGGTFGDFVNSLFQRTPVIYSLIQNLLPVLLQLALFTLIPYVCLYISKPEGHKNRTDLHASAMVKYWIFIIFNFYIFYLLFSSGLDLAVAFFTNQQEIRDAFESLNWSLYGAFYCNYLITLALYDAVFTFLRLKKLIKKYLYRYVARHGTEEEKNEVFAPKEFKYFVSYSKETVYFATIMTFAPIVPMVPICGILAYSMNYLADKNAIVLFSRFDPANGKKMIFIFALFINISMILTFLFWIFFFASHGPSSVLYVVIPTIIVLWVISLLILVATRFYGRFFFKNVDESVEEANPLMNSNFSIDDVVNGFTWEYITDPQRDSADPVIQELLQ